MADEDLNLGEDAGDDDVRAQLSASFDAAVAAAPPDPATNAPVETESARAERIRDEQGRFAAKAERPEGAAPDASAAKGPETPVEPATEAPDAAPVVRPPPGWSAQSKADFAALPAHVQQDIVKRESEVNAGFAKFQDFKGLDDFVAQAKAAGSTPAQVIDAYRTAEGMLRQDFAGGIRQLAQNFGHHPVAAAAGLLGMDPQALVARLNAGQTPGTPQPQDQQAGQPPLHPQVAAELARIQQTVSGLTSERAAHQRAAAAQVVEGFFADPKYPYADNVANKLLDIVNSDPSARGDMRGALERAYDAAVWANPETRDLLIKEQLRTKSTSEMERSAAVVAGARAAGRSITGSPLAGASTQPPPAMTGDIRSDLSAAWDRASARA